MSWVSRRRVCQRGLNLIVRRASVSFIRPPTADFPRVPCNDRAVAKSPSSVGVLLTDFTSGYRSPSGGGQDEACSVGLPGLVTLSIIHEQTGAARGGPRLQCRPLKAQRPGFLTSADAGQIGMIGYLAGGYTALILAGAFPDFAYACANCANHDDPGSCPRSAGSNGTQGAQVRNSLAVVSGLPTPPKVHIVSVTTSFSSILVRPPWRPLWHRSVRMLRGLIVWRLIDLSSDRPRGCGLPARKSVTHSG
ncbi:hypothetical protein BLKGLAD_26030 [Burkholderia gladioli pv. gladioli]